MKPVQRMEFFAGVATLIAAFVGFYKLVLPGLMEQGTGLNAADLLSRAALFLFFPAFLTGLGAYVHAVRKFTFGLVFLLIGGGFLVLFHGFLIMTGVAFYTHDPVTAAIRIMPGLLAALTIFLAFYSRKSGVVTK